MIRERIITVNGLQFKAQMHLEFILLIVEIDNISIIVKHSFKRGISLVERLETFNSSKPDDIATSEYNWLKPLLTTSGQIKKLF